MGVDIITDKMIDLSEQLAADYLETYRRGMPEIREWRGLIYGTDEKAKNVVIVIKPDDSLKDPLTVGGRTDWTTEKYKIIVNAYVPSDDGLLCGLSGCVDEPEFEVSVAKTILHELTHVFDPALSDREMWFPPHSIRDTDLGYFESPREQIAHLNEFHAAIRVFRRHLDAKHPTPRQTKQDIRARILANKNNTYKNWMYNHGRGTEYECHLDKALDNAFGT